MCWPGVTDAAWRPRARPGRHGRRLYIRAPGGQLTTRQLRTVGEVSRRYARDFVTITGQQFRLPLDQARERPEVTARLRAAGLTVTVDPDGAALREIRDQPAVLAGLPRAFTTTVSGSPRQDVLHEAGDVSFSGVRHPGPDRVHRPARPVPSPMPVMVMVMVPRVPAAVAGSVLPGPATAARPGPIVASLPGQEHRSHPPDGLALSPGQ